MDAGNIGPNAKEIADSLEKFSPEADTLSLAEELIRAVLAFKGGRVNCVDLDEWFFTDIDTHDAKYETPEEIFRELVLSQDTDGDGLIQKDEWEASEKVLCDLFWLAGEECQPLMD